jgi:hypothetical protein
MIIRPDAAGSGCENVPEATAPQGKSPMTATGDRQI